jgi:predicted aconitase with swiveling domain
VKEETLLRGDAAATEFRAAHAMGERVEGLALVASDGFSARYDLDRIAGVFTRPQHKLAGQSFVGRILVLETAKGGVASAWMLREMKSRGVIPLGLVFNSVNPIIAQGTAFAGVTMLAGFECDITAALRSGERLELLPAERRVRRITAGR